MLNLHSVPSNYVTAKPTSIVNLKIGDRFAKQSEITTFTSSETQHQFHFLNRTWNAWTVLQSFSRRGEGVLTVGAVSARGCAHAGGEHHGDWRAARDGSCVRVRAAGPASAARVSGAPLSAAESKIGTFLSESVSFFPPLVNFFRASSPLFRLPEMIFFRFRWTDRAMRA